MVFQELPVKNTLTSINLEIIYLNASKKWMLLIYWSGYREIILMTLKGLDTQYQLCI